MNMITLEFSPEQLAVIDEGLKEVPYKRAAPLIALINAQIEAQQVKPDRDE